VLFERHSGIQEYRHSLASRHQFEVVKERLQQYIVRHLLEADVPENVGAVGATLRGPEAA